MNAVLCDLDVLALCVFSALTALFNIILVSLCDSLLNLLT